MCAIAVLFGFIDALCLTLNRTHFWVISFDCNLTARRHSRCTLLHPKPESFSGVPSPLCQPMSSICSSFVPSTLCYTSASLCASTRLVVRYGRILLSAPRPHRSIRFTFVAGVSSTQRMRGRATRTVRVAMELHFSSRTWHFFFICGKIRSSEI